ncbi:MAG: ATP synthase F1 subunit gamma [Clostridia bacterium]|nr:ATP synthase F1 subunit gamma [Clostridia bacterium]
MSATSMKQIKTRIKSIQGTMQITHAMQLVAASRMKKMTDRIEKSKPYFNILRETLDEITADNLDFSSVFTREREGRKCHIVIAGDRGLAGGYNHNLFKSLNFNTDDIIFPIGKKAAEYFSDYKMFMDEYEKAADIEFEDCRRIGDLLAAAYKKGDFTSLYISYTAFKNMLTQEPQTIRLLPLSKRDTKSPIRRDTKSFMRRDTKTSVTIYEPDAEGAFESIIPYYLSGMVYGAVTESVTSETAARRNAMEAATDNAQEMLDRLTLEYNRARQAAVTQELTEIVSGASLPH